MDMTGYVPDVELNPDRQWRGDPRYAHGIGHFRLRRNEGDTLWESVL